MQIIRPAAQRGRGNFGWLDSRHSFSFGRYYDPDQMGFGPLRVINEDRVLPGRGFDEHGHRDMEILSYVIEGALAHRDSTGNGSVIRPGDVQRMSAGTGIRHSEYNASKVAPVHFLQIWIEPEQQGLVPDYEQQNFTRAERLNTMRLVASANGRDDSITVHRDVDVYAGLLDAPRSLDHALSPGRWAWLQVVRGTLTVNGEPAAAGDGVAFRDVSRIELGATADAELLLFDMAVMEEIS